LLFQLNRVPINAVRLAAATMLGTTMDLAGATGSLVGSLAAPLKERATAQAGQVARIGSIPRGVADAVAGLADVGQHRSKRRTWSRDGRAHIEVKGLTGQGGRHRRLSEGVTAALTDIKGVHWAEINAVTQHVLISFDEDEVDLDLLVECIESIEEEHGTEEETFSRAEPAHPSADEPATMAAITLAADLAGLGVAVAGQFFQFRPLPAGARIPLIFAETYPRLRHALEKQLGRSHTELLLSVSTSTMHALSQGPAPLAVDGLHHFLNLIEVRSRQTVWHRREEELVADGRGLPSETQERIPRPAPFPHGPIEKLGDRTSIVAMIGAGGLLAFTRDPGRAAELMLATLPKAARQGREAFASALGWELARRGVVPMDATALRRLDRISVIVIESSVLCTDVPRILSAAAVGTGPDGIGLDDAGVWQIAEQILAAHSDNHGDLHGDIPGDATAGASADPITTADPTVGPAADPAADPTTGPKTDAKFDPAADLPWLRGPGPWTSGEWQLERAVDATPGEADGPTALTLDLRDSTGRRCGRVRIGCEPHPLADALLDAARGAVDRVILTEHDSITELLPWADEVVPIGDHVGDHVRRMQAEGAGVLLVSTDHDAALHAADVGIAVLCPNGSVSWSADLICGPGLSEAWRLLQAVGVARQVSERSTRLALGGSALGALLTVAGDRREGSRRGLAPVHSASMLAVVGGAYSAYRIGRLDVPHPAVRGNWHALSAHDTYTRLQYARQLTVTVEPPGQLATLTQVGRDTLGSVAQLPLVSRLVLTPGRGATALARAVAEELRDPLTPVLAFGAAASAVVGSGVDAVLVGGVMAGNAVISGGQRLRAERALSRLLIGEQISARQVDWQILEPGELWLNGLSDAPSRVVQAQELRPGDVIVVGAADLVPADVRLIDADGLEVDESSLTGESLPVAKSITATPGADLAERACMLYEGCTVLAGTGYAVVVAVDQATEAGRAAAVAGNAARPAGIQARLAELTRIALPAAGLGGLTVTGLAALRGVPLRQAVASGVAIAVAAVPEGLPLVATVAQLAAARRLSRHGILVRSSRTLEALGRVDTLCFDKTGTLTEGRLQVTKLAGLTGEIAFDSPAGEHLLRTAARACPQLDADPDRPVAHATDGAVLEAAHTHNKPDEAWRLLVELPFESNRGYSASLGTNSTRLHLAVKGAPEVILDACTSVLGRSTRKGDAGTGAGTGNAATAGYHAASGLTPLPLTAARLRAAQDVIASLAGTGLRVLAIAEARPPEGAPSRSTDPDSDSGTAVGAPLGADGEPADLAALITGLTLVGFVAIADTPRATAAAAIRRLSGAGVRITMITGDHPTTASAIAEQLGIAEPHRVLTGAQLDSLPKRARLARIAETSVFARVSPEQKVRIVQALQQAGHVVAMTGDGSNDAAAIRLADVGIAMAGRGSISARTAADLVLADPDPTLIVAALLEGRALWGNVRDAVSILVGGNAGEIGFTVLGTAISGRAPLATRQLLLVNMLTDMLPALAVALAPAKPGGDGTDGNVDPLAAGPVAGLWGPALARDLAVRGTATAAGATLAWQCGRMTGRQRRADTMGLGALVGTQLGQTLITGRHSPLVIATSVVSAAALCAIVETPGVSQFFGCTPLGPVGWSVVAGSSAAATLAAVVAPTILDKIGVGVA
jgi:cation-transporting ATPase I